MSGVFLTILRMGLVSGYTVLVVLLVRRLLRRFPKRYSYLLWSVVLLRLVCPVGIESPFSLIPDALYGRTDAVVGGNVSAGGNAAGRGLYRAAVLSARRAESVFAGGEDGDGALPDGDGRWSGMAGADGGNFGIAGTGGKTDGFWELESAAPGNNAGESGNRPQAMQDGIAGKPDGNPQTGQDGMAGKAYGNPQTVQDGMAGKADGNPQTVQDGIAGRADGNPQAMPDIAGHTEHPEGGVLPANPLSGSGSTSLQPWFLPVLSGIWVAGVLLFWFVWAFTVRRFKKKLLGAVRVEIGVYETPQVAASFVDGIFCPVIYLATGLDGAAREYVLCHERVHVRRRDPLIKALALFLVSIYWFHPLVWLAFKKMCEDMEMSCDEQVVERMGTEIKKEYSNTLLRMAQGADGISIFAAFGGNEVKSRVKNILSYRKPKTWLAVLLLLLVAAVGVGLGSNPGGADASAAGKNVEGQDGPDGAGAPGAENAADGKNLTGNDRPGEQNTPESKDHPGGEGLSGTEASGREDVPDKIKEKAGIRPYEYPTEFSLGDDLKTAMIQLALAYDHFDKDSVAGQGWREIFVARFIQNSRASFGYLDMLSGKNDGWVSAEELYYIHYSLTGTELDFSSYAEGSVDRYDDASSFSYGAISGWTYEAEGDGVTVTAELSVEYDGSSAVHGRRLTVNLERNPYSCFDGYSIVSLRSEPADDAAEKYASVLTAYYTALKEEWEPGKLVEEGFGSLAAYCYGEDTLDRIGYAFLDLDGDGTEELLIGAVGGDDFIRRQIFELYYLKDGVPTRVIEAWERNRYYLCREDGSYIIVNESSSSASDGGWSCNAVREGKLVPIKTIVYDAEGETILDGSLADREHPGEDENSGNRVTAEQDAWAIMRAYEEYRVVPEYALFSDFGSIQTGVGEDGWMGKKVSGKNLENQLNLILDLREIWEAADGLVAEETKYAVTDLNGNGRLEIIVASCRGTGHYTYADIYEVSADKASLVHYTRTVSEGDSQADIIWGAAPVYYNRKEKVYRYVFDDLIRDGAAYYYEGKKSLELKDEQILETTLAYRITEYVNGRPVVTYGGGDGLRVSNEQEYQGAADKVFFGWDAGTAYFLWFTAPGQKDDVSSWNEQLETSYRSFSVEEVSSDKAADMDNSKTKVSPEKMAEFISAGGWKINGKDLEEQLNLILSKKPMWELTDTGTDLMWYAVTDLDRNGRLELVAAYCGGSGSDTDSYIYEVSADKSSLAACTRTLSGEYVSCPDIIRGFAPMYLDLTDGKTCFIYPDIIRKGGGHVYESKWILSFGDGHLTEQVLASREAEYDGFTKTVTYRSGELERVAVTSGADYERAADAAFPDRSKGMISIHWIPVDEDFDSGDWYQSLEQSYAGFSFVLPQIPPVSGKKTADQQQQEAFLEQWEQKTVGNGFGDEAEAVAWYETFAREGFRVESGDSLGDVRIGDFDHNGSKDCFFVMTKRTELTDRPWSISDGIFYGCMNGESFYEERISEESLIGLSVVAGDFNHDGYVELILSGDTGSNGGGGNVIHRMLQYREGALLEFPLPEDWSGQFTYRGGFGVSVYETEERKKCRAVLEEDGREVFFTITGSREYATFLDEELPGWRDGKEPFGGAGYGYASFEVVPEDGREYLLAKEYLVPRAGYGQIGFACVLFDWDENGKVYAKDFYVEPF